jgi:hypothetical protein
MSDTDPLARERFRTILLGPIEAEAERIWDDHGISYGDDAAAAEIVGSFPEAYFERRTNDNGVRMRRVVVIGEWEVDPMPAVKNMQEPCDTCASDECGAPSLAEVVAVLRTGSDDPLPPGPVWDSSKRHPYVDTLDHGRSIGLCSHLTMISGHEGILCYATRSDPIHSI